MAVVFLRVLVGNYAQLKILVGLGISVDDVPESVLVGDILIVDLYAAVSGVVQHILEVGAVVILGL